MTAEAELLAGCDQFTLAGRLVALIAVTIDKRLVRFGQQQRFGSFGGDVSFMAVLAVDIGHVESMVRGGQCRAGRIMTIGAESLFVFDQEKLVVSRMDFVAGAAIATASGGVDNPLIHLLFQILMATDTEGGCRFGGQRCVLRGVRLVAVKTLTIAERFVLDRQFLQVAHVCVTIETELIAVIAQQMLEVR